MSAEPGEKCARDPRAARQSDRGGLTVEQLSDEPWGRRRPSMRRLRRDLRPRDHTLPAGAVAGQREDAEHLGGCPVGRARVPEPPIHDDRRRRSGLVHRADLHPEHRCSVWVCDRGPAVGLDRLYRHERVGALERARGGGRARWSLAGAEGRLPRWRDHGPARRRARADRRRRLLRRADIVLQRQPQNGRGRTDRAWLRRLADLGVRRGSAAASSRRRPTSAPTSSARSRPVFPRTIRATRRRSRTTSATTSATVRAWQPTCSRPTRSPR